MPGFAPATLHPLTGPSGDVTFTAQKVGADGAPTGEWVAGRANPLSLDQPVWLRDVPGVDAGTPAIVNSSSVMEVDYTTPDSGNRMLDVLDVGTGVPMAEGVTGRRYQYLDDITLRLTDFDAHVRPRSVAGIDDEGNEVWSRTSPSPDQGFQIADISGLGTRAETGLREHTDLLLLGPDLAIEAIDQSTGQTLWTADGSACSQTNFPEGVRLSPYFVVTSDGLLMQQTDGERVPCAFDRETGAAVDVSSRPSIDWWTSEPPVVYQLMGGLGTGGLYSVNGQPFQDSGPDGVATAIDAVSGETLWTLPIGYDEVWRYAGGRLVGIAGGTVSGIG
jgi:hypothetical protein